MNKQNFDPVDINDEYFKKLAENELKNQDIDNLDDAEPEEDYQDINEDSESDAKAITITCSQLNNVNEIGTVSAVSYNGIGIITSIVLYFVEFFGCGSDMYANKILRAERSARRKLISRAKVLKADGIMNYKVQVTNRTVFVYGTAYKN